MAVPVNRIIKSPIASLGYHFIKREFLPEGKDEYYLRNIQNRYGIQYRHLSAYEIEVLVRNRNTCDNWNNFYVSDAFNPELVKNCKFYGLVRIGKLEPLSLEFSDLKVPVGLYNSTIISCDFGDNVVVDNVNYLSHYIIGSEVIIVNVNELVTTNHAKFGNGILKEGEHESVRIWMELCNENAGRKIIPFNGMLPGDAYLWTKYRNDEALLQKFREFTEKDFDKKRGYYGKIGNRTIIKNCSIIKDVWIGDDAYLKGANKLKNLTINSGPEGKSQIGEGCELVNGIVGYGCRIFYGVKAVRFIMASHSQLKYGARLINSYLGNNATISCCEVLNSLIFPAHEQHHNNSFLCASLVMGQSNIAAGATIGSNHNSRGADGEIVAGRGFWPGLCVSLKHNSKFATYTMLAKGDYPAELNITLPFSLVSNDVASNQLVVMPAYWFMYNMYALQRNSHKYLQRDKRADKAQYIEYDYLAPDSVNEIIAAIELLQLFTGRAWLHQQLGTPQADDETARAAGAKVLHDNDPIIDTLEILAAGFENSNRKIVIKKVRRSYHVYKELVALYMARQLTALLDGDKTLTLADVKKKLPATNLVATWQNIGGQLIPALEVDSMLEKVKTGKITSWKELHEFYKKQEQLYPLQKLQHAAACYYRVTGIHLRKAGAEAFEELLVQSLDTMEWMNKGIYASRAKDYSNTFRKMVYDNQEEMDAVLGRLQDNAFINEQQAALKQYRKKLATYKKRLAQTEKKHSRGTINQPL